MPFYEYRCSACAFQDSFLESMNASAQKTCPECGKKRAFKRLISAAGFQLKGSGWYVTDFRDSGKKKASDKKDTATAATAATDTEKKSETKSGENKSSDSASTSSTSSTSSNSSAGEKTDKKPSKNAKD